MAVEDEDPFLPSKGWAEMIKKVYEIDPLICPQCGGRAALKVSLRFLMILSMTLQSSIKVTKVSFKPVLIFQFREAPQPGHQKT